VATTKQTPRKAPLVIQIRGTSGSGKSTVVRWVMDRFCWNDECCSPIVAISGRNRPTHYRMSYRYNPGELPRDVVVLGTYHTQCGGCDRIRKPDGSSPSAQTFCNVIKDVVFDVAIGESLLFSEDVKWTLDLVESGYEVRCLFLCTDPEECLLRVQKRQQEKGREPPDPARVRRKLMTRVGTIDRARLRLIDAGVLCRRVSCLQATGIVLRWIKERGATHAS
jgi:hypothetical protein